MDLAERRDLNHGTWFFSSSCYRLKKILIDTNNEIKNCRYWPNVCRIYADLVTQNMFTDKIRLNIYYIYVHLQISIAFAIIVVVFYTTIDEM